MNLTQIKDLLDKIQGCTFASMDSETSPMKGFRKVTLNQSIIMFTNKKSSGYANMVKRRLSKAGKDPSGFHLGPLPWGQRVKDTPLIMYEGKIYLQVILLSPGESQYFIGQGMIDPTTIKEFRREIEDFEKRLKDGKPLIRTYALENITRIALMGEDIHGTRPERPVLRLKH